MNHAMEFGGDREQVERRYRDARAAYILAAQELSRFGTRYEELVSAVPDSIDLAGNPGMEREPHKPVSVMAHELEPRE